MVCISSNNDRHPVPTTFTPLQSSLLLSMHLLQILQLPMGFFDLNSTEQCSELMGNTKGGPLFDYRSNYYFFKSESPPWNYYFHKQ